MNFCLTESTELQMSVLRLLNTWPTPPGNEWIAIIRKCKDLLSVFLLKSHDCVLHHNLSNSSVFSGFYRLRLLEWTVRKSVRHLLVSDTSFHCSEVTGLYYVRKQTHPPLNSAPPAWWGCVTSQEHSCQSLFPSFLPSFFSSTTTFLWKAQSAAHVIFVCVRDLKSCDQSLLWKIMTSYLLQLVESSGSLTLTDVHVISFSRVFSFQWLLWRVSFLFKQAVFKMTAATSDSSHNLMTQHLTDIPKVWKIWHSENSAWILAAEAF